ncbi:hypothetical protein RP20_CCG026160 [Aedes albopictus]|nr:hypothetical protein RP20_CCG026160 [Aedes albopictus]
MGAIGWTQDDGKVLWHCGGTLIWMDYVLTAAHCVVDHHDVRPDIVRFGDLNLETDEDDEYAQQYKIVQIYRHPLHRFGVKYHDIALMKLEQPVRLHDTVCPACLWIDPEIHFTKFTATGWGSTGHFQNRTPSLLKVSLKPLDTSICGTFYTSEFIRGLNAGLHENHLCAVDEKMDTCEGDSGGPLQVKLLHHIRLTPFIVAVTSFGLPCGSSNPGVYTKIGPYHDWILATMRKGGAVIEDDIFNATICALRFQKFREGIYTLPYNETHVYEDYSLTDHIYTEIPPTYLVQILWNIEGGPQNCYGTIIDENTVLTVASCVHHQGTPASAVSHPQQGVLNISKINVHPQYNPAYGYNNIAILRLEKLYSFINIRPACIGYGNLFARQPNSVFGFGRKDIYDCMDFPECIDPSLKPLIVYVEPKDEKNCRLPREFVPRYPDGITDELICAVEMLQPFSTTDDTNLKYIDLLTMYNSDCQRTHAHPIRDSHICVKYPYREYTCFPSHSMLRWEDAEGVPYLIGLSTDTRECMGWSYMTFSRIAAFIDWIVDNIADEEIRRSFNV